MRKVLKIFKWLLIGTFSFFVLVILVFGINISSSKGNFKYSWSGLRALWDKDMAFGIFENQKMYAEFNGIDGPYFYNDSIFYVDAKNNLEGKKYFLKDSIKVIVNNENKDSFCFLLNNEPIKHKEVYQIPDKLIAISDIEGNFNAFSSFLINNKVMDENYTWIFDKGHLVLNGDFVDRGGDVFQVLWLIYYLEQQAEKSGGKVHYLMGNHEIMNFQGRWKYNDRKYLKAYTSITKIEAWDVATKKYFSKETILGKWMQTKYSIIKIGNYLFVHGGLSPKLMSLHLDIQSINQIAHNYWTKDLYNNPTENKKANFVIGNEGPFWYRGMATDYKYYDKINQTDMNNILDFYNAKKIIIGHSIVEDISYDFNKKLIKIDVVHGKEKNSTKTKGLYIKDSVEYKVDGLGYKVLLK